MIKVSEQDEQRTVRARAIGLLARREHSHRELTRKLADAEPQTVAVVLDQLQAEGWLSDQRFAKQMIRQRIRKGQGPLRIRADLLAHGVDSSVIATAMEAEEPDWAEHLASVAEKKRQGTVFDKAAQAKLGRFLLTRGFPESMVRQYLRHTH
ncbi:MAG: regulatory protein RecX [Pseudomonadota bacterium]